MTSYRIDSVPSPMAEDDNKEVWVTLRKLQGCRVAGDTLGAWSSPFINEYENISTFK